MAALPLRDMDAALRELDHAFGTLRVDGVGLPTNDGDVWLSTTVSCRCWMNSVGATG